MSRIERPSDDVLVLKLSDYHSLDLVRLPKSQRYRIVFAERFGVQRRAFVEIDYQDGIEISKFLASIFNPEQIVKDPEDEEEPFDLPPIPPVPPRTKTKL